MEHAKKAEDMEEEAERMEHHSEQLGERIEDAEADWERKEHDPSVPGAQPDESEADESEPDESVPDE